MHIAVAVARKSRAMCEFRLIGTMFVHPLSLNVNFSVEELLERKTKS